MKKQYWKVIAALVVIFCAGQGVGYIWAARLATPPAVPELKSWTDGWVETTLSRLQSDLDLSEAQVSSIKPTLYKTGSEIQLERRRALFQIHLNILDVHSEIAPHLTEEQTIRFNESRNKLEIRIRREFPEIMENIGKELLIR